MNYRGYRLVEAPYLAEYELILRTWKERLFSWPWKPWKKYKQVEKYTGNFIINNEVNIIYASPASYLKLKKLINYDPIL